MGEKNILLKVHDSYRWVVAICDGEVRGKILEDDKVQLDLTTQFFDGEELTEEEVRREIERCVIEDASFNIVGERSVGIAKEMGLVNDSGIGKIEGVPFALVLV